MRHLHNEKPYQIEILSVQRQQGMKEQIHPNLLIKCPRDLPLTSYNITDAVLEKRQRYTRKTTSLFLPPLRHN